MDNVSLSGKIANPQIIWSWGFYCEKKDWTWLAKWLMMRCWSLKHFLKMHFGMHINIQPTYLERKNINIILIKYIFHILDGIYNSWWLMIKYYKGIVAQCVYLTCITSRTICDNHQIDLLNLQNKIWLVKVKDLCVKFLFKIGTQSWRLTVSSLFQSGLRLVKPEPAKPQIRLAPDEVGKTTWHWCSLVGKSSCRPVY